MSETFPRSPEKAQRRSRTDGERGTGPGPDDPCSLCGLPVGRWGIRQTGPDVPLRFCCPGCMHVFQILSNLPGGPPSDFTKTDLYRACVASGVISRPDGNASATDSTREADDERLRQVRAQGEIPAEELTLKVDGMWCTACSWLVETVLRRTEGIRDAKVYFSSDLASIKYLPHRVTPPEIAARLARFGYRAAPFDAPIRGSADEKRIFVRLGISAILTMNVMMVSCALYFGFLEELGREAVQWISYILLILSTPVVFYGGFPIFKRAFLGLRYANVSMDTLIAMGTLAAYFYSILRMTGGSIHLYFDTAATLVTLVLLGRSIEAHARRKASQGISELFGLAGSKVRLYSGDGEKWVPIQDARPGDEFLVLAGERSPLDGEIANGEGRIDESVLTGESKPVKKTAGDEVMGGSLVLDGRFRLKATRVGSSGSLNRIVAAVMEALAGKDRIELLSDRITRWFVPIVILLAAGTGFVLLHAGTSPDEAMLRALTVLVITCPCALGIAAPLAKVAAIGCGRSRGILIRNPSTLERAKDLDILIFDKTGTLTEGSFTLIETVAFGVLEEEALRRTASIEVQSGHFLAKGILQKAREKSIEIEEAVHIESFEGLGVRGVLRCGEVSAGSRRFMESLGMKMPARVHDRAESAEERGATAVFFAWDGEVRGTLLFGDTVREGARQSISDLQQKGLDIRLVSGDSIATTRVTARQLGIAKFTGQALPSEKTHMVRELQEAGHCVGMVGDGMNDAAALAQADAGFAAGTDSFVPQEASDITLLGKTPAARAAAAIELSSATCGIIRQNLFFAFFYNLLGIPLAASGLLNPLLAVLAMFASSLTVILNTLRISKSK